MPRTAQDELELVDVGGADGDFGRGGNGGDYSRAQPRLPQHIYVTGMMMALLAILMFFLALTSAYVVRKGTGDDWQSLALPRILWLNTAVLLASSFSLERGRRQLSREHQAEFRRWWQVTTALGMLFLAGQLMAWRQLAAAGVYLASNPSSSFFYVLTATHGAHLLGGIVALFYVHALGSKEAVRARLHTAANITSIYWHFLDGLWILVFLLLLLGR